MANEIGNLAQRLERLSAKILGANGYEILGAARPRRVPDVVDIEARELRSGDTFVVEVKLYRSPRIDRRVLRNAAVQVVHYKAEYRAKGMLIATTRLGEAENKLLRNIGVDQIWDVDELRARAGADPDLLAELEKLLRDAELRFAGPAPNAGASVVAPVALDLEAEQTGAALIEKLNKTKAGRPDARKFEQLCTESIQYLFGDQLGQLQSQNRIEQGFQYMDLIARLAPDDTSSFWISLAQDFRCRYVVFEFKNYEEAISQNQIYTTEKYLYPNALRSVAIIIARNGHDSGAKRAVQGSLRESGKVILVLSLNNLADLLLAKDNGLEPSDLMIDHLDSLLMTVAP